MPGIVNENTPATRLRRIRHGESPESVYPELYRGVAQMTDAEKLADVERKLTHQRSMVQLAHQQFHEWANSKGNGFDVLHGPEEENDPAALMRRIIGWYEERAVKQ